jgi:hypothetical protein
MAAAPPAAKRHRTATVRPYRRAAVGSHDTGYPAAWHERHFVLMLGIGY